MTSLHPISLIQLEVRAVKQKPRSTTPIPYPPLQLLYRLYIMLCLSIPTLSAFAQGWEWQYPSPQANNLYTVSFVNDRLGWAAGYDGTILHTTNSGENWSFQSVDTRMRITDITFIDSLHGWATTDYNPSGLYRTEDGGLHWSIIPSEIGMNAVCFIDSLSGWFACSHTHDLYHSTDGGVTWALQSTFTSTILDMTYLKYLGTTHVWASTEDGQILHSIDGGVTWAITDVLPGLQDHIHKISFADRMNGLATGEYIYVTHNGGVTWSHQDLNEHFYGASMMDTDNGCAAGSSGAVYFTTNGGTTWFQRGQFTNLFDVQFTDSNTGWLVGSSGTIYHTRDMGLNWINQQQGLLYTLNDISFIGDNGLVVGNNGSILRTTNRGVNWDREFAHYGSLSFPRYISGKSVERLD